MVHRFPATKFKIMLRCIAIDDEELALDLLEDNISKVPWLQMVAKFNNPLHAMNFIQEEQVDLVFLDIQMPGLSGLQFIQSLANKPMFILVTAYQKFALEGFNLSVVDYLVKPVALDRFIQACNRARELHQLKKNNTDQKEATYFFINVDYSLVKINFDDIIWIEGLKDYMKIHLEKTTRPIIARATIKSMEQQLPASLFIRIHKSYIVSKKHITAIRKNSVFLNSMELNVGDNYKHLVAALAGKPIE